MSGYSRRVGARTITRRQITKRTLLAAMLFLGLCQGKPNTWAGQAKEKWRVFHDEMVYKPRDTTILPALYSAWCGGSRRFMSCCFPDGGPVLAETA
ncbi:hypothetical protein ACQKWADRAFT_285505 [Trichoderma austrokoningii]